MKAKKKLALTPREWQHVEEVLQRSRRRIPQPPLSTPDIEPESIPVILSSEVRDLLDAYNVLQIAKADFDLKHGAVKLHMLHLGRVESVNFDVHLDKDGVIVIRDLSSEEEEVTRIVPICK